LDAKWSEVAIKEDSEPKGESLEARQARLRANRDALKKKKE